MEKKCLACDAVLAQRPGESAAAFAKRKNCGRRCASESRGKERGEKLRYPSKHASETGETRWISPGQYLAEHCTERFARKSGKELPVRFWDKEPWRSFYLKQLFLANRLLKKYSPAAISKALRSPQGRSTYSLGANWLPAIIEEEQKKIDAVVVTASEEVGESEEKNRPVFVRKVSLLTKLAEHG